MEDMVEAMSKDKKAEDGKIHFVLPASFGDVRIVDLTLEEVLSMMS
jgi:3-dehydroquinate synthetase